MYLRVLPNDQTFSDRAPNEIYVDTTDNLRIFYHCWVTPYLADYQNFKITAFESFFESSEMCDQWARNSISVSHFR